MKKILILCLIAALLMSATALAYNNQEIEDRDTLSELDEKISDISDIIEMIKEKSITKNDELISEQKIKDSDTLSKETMFVTGIKGDYYKDYNDIPIPIRYTYRRPSDGAIFTGYLFPYYLKGEIIGGDMWWQAFYEGTLTLQYYEY